VVVLTTGTFLKAIMHTGEAKTQGGRAGDTSADGASATASPRRVSNGPFKTGTPCGSMGGPSTSRSASPARRRSAGAVQFSTDRITCRRLLSFHADERRRSRDHPRESARARCTRSDCRPVRAIVRHRRQGRTFAHKDSHLILPRTERTRHPEYYSTESAQLPRTVQQAMLRLIPGLGIRR